MRHRGAVTSTPTGISKTIDLDGPTHYLDFGGPADSPQLILVHGLGGAAWNWVALAPLLTGTARVLAVDLAGHGLTPAAGRPTTIGANRRLLDRFIRAVADDPVVLVGNSMGGLLSSLEASAAPDLVRGLALVDPALPRPILSPVDARVGAQFAVAAMPIVGAAMYARRRNRLSARQVIRQTFELCTSDVERIPAFVYDEAERVVRSRDLSQFPPRDVLTAGRSVMRRMTRASALRKTLESIKAPVLLIHGDKDRLVPVQAARRTASMFTTWRYEEMADVGHIPMLEAPDATAAIILRWLEEEVR
jgi:pimeloyl-ACP methyl ester carboxylesterase